MTLQQVAVASSQMAPEEKSGTMTPNNVLRASTFLYVWGSSKAVSWSFEQKRVPSLMAIRDDDREDGNSPKKCEGFVRRVLESSNVLTRVGNLSFKVV